LARDYARTKGRLGGAALSLCAEHDLQLEGVNLPGHMWCSSRVPVAVRAAAGRCALLTRVRRCGRGLRFHFECVSATPAAPRPTQLAPPRPRRTAVPTRRGMGEAGFRPRTPPGRLRNVRGQHTRSVGSVIVLWRQFRIFLLYPPASAGGESATFPRMFSSSARRF
jgi:hypothetical protein